MPDDDIVLPTDTKSEDEPPPTDGFYPSRTILSKNLIDTVKFAVAMGLGLAVVIAIISAMVALRGTDSVQIFFESIFPGFDGGNVGISFVIGFFWSFIYGFVFGAIIGIVYNSLVRATFIDRESWESLS